MTNMNQLEYKYDSNKPGENESLIEPSKKKMSL